MSNNITSGSNLIVSNDATIGKNLFVSGTSSLGTISSANATITNLSANNANLNNVIANNVVVGGIDIFDYIDNNTNNNNSNNSNSNNNISYDSSLNKTTITGNTHINNLSAGSIDANTIKLNGANVVDSITNSYTSYVDTKISNLIGGAPASLDTLKEITDLLSSESNSSISQTLISSISGINSSITSLQNNVTQLQTNDTVQANVNTSTNNSITNINTTLSGVDSKLFTINSNIASLQSDNTINTNSITTLNSSVTDLSSKVGTLTSTSSTNTNNIATLTNSLNTLDAKVTVNQTSVQSTVTALNSEVDSLQASMNQALTNFSYSNGKTRITDLAVNDATITTLRATTSTADTLLIGSTNVMTALNGISQTLTGIVYDSGTDITYINNHVVIPNNNTLYLGDTTFNTKTEILKRPLLTGDNAFIGTNTFASDTIPLKITTKNNPSLNNALTVQYASANSQINDMVKQDDLMIFTGTVINGTKNALFIGPWANGGGKGIRISSSKLEVGPGIIETLGTVIDASTSKVTIKPQGYNGGLEVYTTNGTDASLKTLRLSITDGGFNTSGYTSLNNGNLVLLDSNTFSYKNITLKNKVLLLANASDRAVQLYQNNQTFTIDNGYMNSSRVSVTVRGAGTYDVDNNPTGTVVNALIIDSGSTTINNNTAISGTLSTTSTASLCNGVLDVTATELNINNKTVHYVGASALFYDTTTKTGTSVTNIYRNPDKNLYIDSDYFKNSSGGGVIFRLRDKSEAMGGTASNVLNLQPQSISMTKDLTVSASINIQNASTTNNTQVKFDADGTLDIYTNQNLGKLQYRTKDNTGTLLTVFQSDYDSTRFNKAIKLQDRSALWLYDTDISKVTTINHTENNVIMTNRVNGGILKFTAFNASSINTDVMHLHHTYCKVFPDLIISSLADGSKTTTIKQSGSDTVIQNEVNNSSIKLNALTANGVANTTLNITSAGCAVTGDLAVSGTLTLNQFTTNNPITVNYFTIPTDVKQIGYTKNGTLVSSTVAGLSDFRYSTLGSMQIPAGVWQFSCKISIGAIGSSSNMTYGVSITNTPAFPIGTTPAPLNACASVEQTNPIPISIGTVHCHAFSFCTPLLVQGDLYVMFALKWSSNNSGTMKFEYQAVKIA